MKNTQKKLKAKHFRYLSKDVVKNPMIYVRDYYSYWTNLNIWIKEIELLLNTGMYPEMFSSDFFESGYHCKKLIEQIEVAYVIYKQCQIQRQSNPLMMFATKEDYSNYVFKWEYTHCGKSDPIDTLSKFFSFQSLEEWYGTMDDLWMYMTERKSRRYDKFGDKIVAIRELLIRLAHALHDIYEAGGIRVQVPSYFIAEPDIAHEGKMPRSKLGELMDEASGEVTDKEEEISVV